MGRFKDQSWQVAMTYLSRRSIVVVGIWFFVMVLPLTAWNLSRVGPCASSLWRWSRYRVSWRDS